MTVKTRPGPESYRLLAAAGCVNVYCILCGGYLSSALMHLDTYVMLICRLTSAVLLDAEAGIRHFHSVQPGLTA